MAVIVDVDGDSLVVYASSVNPAAGSRLTKLFGLASGGVNDPLAVFQSHARYAPELRFSLTNEDHRLYSAQRWCYRGGIDDWLCLWGVKSLETLARKYLPHLGQESFFELI